MRFKSLLVLLLVVALFLHPGYSIADGGETILAIEPTENKAYSPGESFSVEVALASPTDDIYMFQFAIEYNPEVLTLVSSTAGEFFSTAGSPTVNTSISGVIYVNWDSINVPISSDSVLLHLVFTVCETEAKSTEIRFSNSEEIIFANWDNEIDVSIRNTVINIGSNWQVSFSVPAGVTAPTTMTCPEGESVTLPIADAPEGYSFLGWVTEDYANVAEIPSTVLTGSYTPTADITLKALYSHAENVAGAFTLVTEAPESWEGSYVITNGNTETLYALKGLIGTKKYESKIAGGAVALADTGMTLDDETLANVTNDYIFMIDAAGEKFTMKNAATGMYVASRGGYLYSYKSDTANYCRWTFTMNGTILEASNGASKTIPFLGFSANNYFMINRTVNPEICFWKLIEAHEVVVYTTVID